MCKVGLAAAGTDPPVPGASGELLGCEETPSLSLKMCDLLGESRIVHKYHFSIADLWLAE